MLYLTQKGKIIIWGDNIMMLLGGDYRFCGENDIRYLRGGRLPWLQHTGEGGRTWRQTEEVHTTAMPVDTQLPVRFKSNEVDTNGTNKISSAQQKEKR